MVGPYQDFGDVDLSDLYESGAADSLPVQQFEAVQQPAPQPVGPPQQPIPVFFTQADNLQLQRLQQGLSSVRQEVGDGILEPQEGQQLVGQIMQQLKPLTMRQQKFQQQQQQQVMQQTMQQQAMARSLQQADLAHAAQGITSRIIPYVDPLTGDLAHLYEDQGDIKEVAFTRASASREQTAGGAEESEPAPSEPQQAESPGGAAEGDEEGGEAPDRKPHALTIQNGDRREVYVFPDIGGGKHGVPKKVFDSADPEGSLVTQEQLDDFQHQAETSTPGGPEEPGRNAAVTEAFSRLVDQQARSSASSPQRAAQQVKLTQAEVTELTSKAKLAAGPPPNPSSFSNDTHGRIAFQRAMQAWNSRVGSMAQNWGARLLDEKKQAAAQAGRSAESQRAEQSRATEAQRRETIKAETEKRKKEAADFEKTRPKPLTDAQVLKEAKAQAELAGKKDDAPTIAAAEKKVREAHAATMEAWEGEKRKRNADPQAVQVFQKIAGTIGTTQAGGLAIDTASDDQLKRLDAMLEHPEKIGMKPEQAKQRQKEVRQVLKDRQEGFEADVPPPPPSPPTAPPPVTTSQRFGRAGAEQRRGTGESVWGSRFR